MADPQQPSSTDRSDADDVEQHACPKCDAQPGSHASTTAIHTCVSSDFRTRSLRRVLDATVEAVLRPGRTS
ncbi:hypothetical protein [Streptomyces sp. NPDC007904]|uniref:hypothetical protein n=1 Tax=Streptomyces sp. NPDC007904 TaxID=3364787 RepID=UPI0036DFCB33